MPRSKAIFDHVFCGAAPLLGYELFYVSVTDSGLEPAAVAARCQREEQSRQNWLATTRKLAPTLAALHEWLYTDHACYAVGKEAASAVQSCERGALYK